MWLSDQEGYDQSKPTFLFVNDKYITDRPPSKLSPATIQVDSELTKPGTYTLSAIQYENNDPVKGKVVEFHQTTYTIKQTK